MNAMSQKIKLLMIDNYDSFTYNIVQYFGELGAEVEVFRNDEITIEQIAARKPERLVVSPGPCSPLEAGISVAAIQHFAGKLPILGVCLGHQSIGAAFGGNIVRAQELMHGKTSVITHHPKPDSAACLPGCLSSSLSTVTIRWRLKSRPALACWKSRPGQTTARSWVCGTKRCRLRACSFTPNRY